MNMIRFIKVGVALTVVSAAGAVWGATAETGGAKTATPVLASYNEGLSLLKAGKQEAALEAFIKVVAGGAKMTEPEARAMVSSSADKAGMILMEQGKLEAAESMTLKAIAVNPRNALALNTLGMIFLKQNKAEKAANCFKAAMRADPQLAASYRNLTGMMMAKGDLVNAAQYLTMALEADPADLRLLDSLARVYEQDKKPELAEKTWKTLLQKTKDSPRAKLQLGEFYLRTGSFDKARPLFQEVAAANPKLLDARLLLVRLLAREGKTAEAEKAGRILLKEFPDDLAVRAELVGLVNEAAPRKEKKP